MPWRGGRRPSRFYIYKGIATQPGDQQARTPPDTDEVYGESQVRGSLDRRRYCGITMKKPVTVDRWQDGIQVHGRQGADLAAGGNDLRLDVGISAHSFGAGAGVRVDDLVISAEPFPSVSAPAELIHEFPFLVTNQFG